LLPQSVRNSFVLNYFKVFIVVNSLLGDTFYPEYLLTDDYAQKHFVYKYAYALCTLKLKIFTYYTAFCLMHTATIASGLAFNGYDENSKKM
jgi:hypothetical protein